MYIAILGRQPVLGIAELEKVFGKDKIEPISPESALVDTETLEIQRLGGVMKAGKIIVTLKKADWSQMNQKIIQYYIRKLSSMDGKITFGISAYNLKISGYEVQKTGIILKRKLKQNGVSLRLIPNTESALSTATSHHNKLGLSENKIELIIVRADNGMIYAAESTGSQNITAYANRDQQRPKRDSYVGMLPPKLAQIMVNLAVGGLSFKKPPIVLDPFCGTGVILQEALLMGYLACGTDLSEKMSDYSRQNLEWLEKKYPNIPDWRVSVGDATETKWNKPIDAIVSETYLGQPFSAPPSKEKLIEVKNNCNHIIGVFLKNLSSQIISGTPVCIAVPAWRDISGDFTHLPLISKIGDYGYEYYEFKNIKRNELIYYRPDQIVARELLVLIKK